MDYPNLPDGNQKILHLLMKKTIGLAFYRIGLSAYNIALHTAAILGHDKARLWVHGRRNWKSEIEKITAKKKPIIWFHCASLGEYEMAIPVMKRCKASLPQYAILVSFFSPSGFENCKPAEHYDYKVYLPLDTPKNARFFVEKLHPEISIFIKYELWFYYLNALRKIQSQTYLVNARWNENAIFYKWYGFIHRQMLHCFDYIFVSDEKTEALGRTLVNSNTIIPTTEGRIERAMELKEEHFELSSFEIFKNNKKIIIAGSSYALEESLMFSFLKKFSGDYKLIIAPHHISERRLDDIYQKFYKFNPIKLSDWENLQEKELKESKVLIIDSIGQLSKLYRFADLALIGGGFNGALHNAFEALVNCIPVLFGPKYGEDSNWQDLLKRGLAYTAKNEQEFNEQVAALLKPNKLEAFQANCEAFWENQSKSSDQIFAKIESEIA